MNQWAGGIALKATPLQHLYITLQGLSRRFCATFRDLSGHFSEPVIHPFDAPMKSHFLHRHPQDPPDTRFVSFKQVLWYYAILMYLFLTMVNTRYPLAPLQQTFGSLIVVPRYPLSITKYHPVSLRRPSSTASGSTMRHFGQYHTNLFTLCKK